MQAFCKKVFNNFNFHFVNNFLVKPIAELKKITTFALQLRDNDRLHNGILNLLKTQNYEEEHN